MAKVKYTLGGEGYSTKKAVIERRSSLAQYEATYEDQECPDFQFLRDLYGRHPELWGKEILRVTFEWSDVHKHNVANVFTAQHSAPCQPSYKHCLSINDDDIRAGYFHLQSVWDASVRAQLPAKLRSQIKYQVDAARGMSCEHCGKTDGLDVDHCNEGGFQRIFDAWTYANRDQLTYSDLRDMTDIGGVHHFADPSMTASWCDYHAEKAELQTLCKDCHKKVTKSRKSE